MTQPKKYIKEPLKYAALFKWYYRKFPKVYEMLSNRAELYNQSLRKLEQLEKRGIVYVIRPEKSILINRIENDPSKTSRIYNDAIVFAKNEFPKIEKWLVG